MVIEPASIISACGDGRKAAEAICGQLGVAFEPSRTRPLVLSDDDIDQVKAARARRIDAVTPTMLAAPRRTDFALIESTMTDDQARAEAMRCVQCTTVCDKCVEVCPNRANYTFTMQPVQWTLPVLSGENGRVRVTGAEDFRIDQHRQILHVDDFCNECDNCQTFCVHHGRPYADKPRLFLTRDAFALEHRNAYFVEGRTIWRREGGQESSLTRAHAGVVYEDDSVRISLSGDWLVREIAAKVPFAETRSIRLAAEMAVLYEGITRALPFLLLNDTGAHVN
jgi:putative selenate reductase